MIYVLIHPNTLEVRYVGKARNISYRFGHHRSETLHGSNYSVHRWWRSLPNEPCVVPIGEGDSLAEVIWIAWFRAQGARLLNCTDGGDGCSGSLEVREKISRSLTGRPLSQAHRERIRQGMQHAFPPEVRLKISEGVRRAMTPEVRARIGAAGKGNTYRLGKALSEEHKRSISNAMKGNTHLLGKSFSHTPEARRKMSEAKKQWWVERKAITVSETL